MDILTLLLIVFTFSALFLSYHMQQKNLKSNRLDELSGLLQKENELLTRKLHGENLIIPKDFDTLRKLYEHIYHL